MEPVSASAVAEAPVKKVKLKKERHTHEHQAAKPKDIVMPPLGESVPSNNNLVQSVEAPLNKEYLDALAFNEDKLTIIISPSSEKFAPKYVDCWVNGRGIEVLMPNGKWIEFKAIPVAKRVVTKRKYVEVLIRMKRQDVTTVVINNDPTQDPINKLDRIEAVVHGITIVHDPSPKGAEWFNRLVQLQ